MRILLFFDLPTITEMDRKTATVFRKFLIDDGFIMMQLSVYSRICKNGDDIIKHTRRIHLRLPKKGNVRLLTVTEKQYENMEMLCGSQTYEETIGSSPLIVFE